MTLPALPPQGSTNWYAHYTQLDALAREVDTGRLTDASLKAAIDAHLEGLPGAADGQVLGLSSGALTWVTGGGSAPTVTNALLTEAGDYLTTESGDYLVTA